MRANSVCPTGFLLALILVAMTARNVGAVETRLSRRNERLPCKYSVRDVGFVDVHDSSWQFELVWPSSMRREEKRRWDAKLRQVFQRANASFQWVDENSDTVQAWRAQLNREQKEQRLLGRLSGRTGRNALLFSQKHERFEKALFSTIELTLDSKLRQQILRGSASSMAVLLLIPGRNDTENERVKSLLEKVVGKINREKWILAKPVDQGPVIVAPAREDWKSDPWLSLTLGVETGSEPQVAIVFGQGRRLGEVLTGESIELDNVVRQASFAGHDCECDLDPNWLYSGQVLHRWTIQYERIAERTLEFDPRSVIVEAEVRQILQKNRSRTTPSPAPPVNLGPGLVIHELEPLEGKGAKVVLQDSGRQKQENRTIASSQAEPTLEPATEQRGKDDRKGNGNLESRVRVPWVLIAVMLILILVTSVYFWIQR